MCLGIDSAIVVDFSYFQYIVIVTLISFLMNLYIYMNVCMCIDKVSL